MSEDPYLYLGAAPREPTSVPTLFRSEGIRGVLQHPPSIRPSSVGFDLSTLDLGEIVEGKKLTFGSRDRKKLDLYPGGIFVATAVFPGFLGWPRGRDEFQERPTINSLALVEFTYDFVLTYSVLTEWFEPTPTRFKFRVGIRDALLPSGKPVRLPPYGLRAVAQVFGEGRDAQSRALDAELAVVERESSGLDVGRVAYELLVKVYTWFGHPEDVIPYASHEERRVLAADLEHT